MKTLWKTVIKNTGNLDTINISATNESKESAVQSNAPAHTHSTVVAFNLSQFTAVIDEINHVITHGNKCK